MIEPPVERLPRAVSAFSAIRRFFELEAAGGIVLVCAAAVGLLCVDTPGVAHWYRGLLNVPVQIRVGSLALSKNVLLVVNGGLMAVFFLLGALEIKREIREGELSSLTRIALPVIAAIAGIVAPAII